MRLLATPYMNQSVRLGIERGADGQLFALGDIK